MRTLIVTEFVTLDGVMEAPGGEPTHPHAGWVIDLSSPEQLQYKLDETLAAESLLLGRVTYEGFAAAWPSRDGEFADKMNSMPKHVASTTLHDVQWNATLLHGDVPTAVRALKSGDGGPILVAGSCTLVHTLLLNGLVDELRLMVFPVSVGRGLRVFPEDQTKLTWKLVDQQTFPTGVMALTFHQA
jgi:dihydrofolate reductase